MTLGIDVSNYQGAIDWQQVKDAGVGFVYVLVTDGTGFVNPDAAEQIKGALDVGLPVGGYHFARPTAGDARTQAEHFTASCPPGCTLPPMLDSETSWLGERTANAAWVIDWFDAINPPKWLWYTNADGVIARVDSVMLQRAGVLLWLAAPGQPDMRGRGAWALADVVQYGTAPIPGVSGAVDVDRTEPATLDALLNHQEETDMPYPSVKLDDGMTVVALGPDGPWHVPNPDTLNIYVFAQVLTAPGDPLGKEQSDALRAALAERQVTATTATVDTDGLATKVAEVIAARLGNG